MYASLQVKYPFFLSDLISLKSCRQIFEKYSTIKFNANPSSGSRVVPYGRKDGQTDMQADRWTDMTKLVVIFRNFSKAPKNCINIRYCAATNKIMG